MDISRDTKLCDNPPQASKASGERAANCGIDSPREFTDCTVLYYNIIKLYYTDTLLVSIDAVPVPYHIQVPPILNTRTRQSSGKPPLSERTTGINDDKVTIMEGAKGIKAEK